MTFFALFKVVRPQHTGEVRKLIIFCC